MAYTREQRKNQRTSIQIARERGASPRVIKALLEAEGVESNYRNLNYGDRDSKGILQQRPSQGWGKAGSVEQDVHDFLDRAIKLDKTFKGSSGQLAQAIQRSAYPGKYAQRSREAQRLLKGGGGVTPTSSGATPGLTDASFSGGVDNSKLRQQLKAQYLLDRGNPDALLSLAAGLQQAQDVPGTLYYKTEKSTSGASYGGKKKGQGKLLELFWQGPGGINAKDGKKVPQGFVSGHTDHVHVAAGPHTVVELGKLAEKMGLRVGENPHFGRVNPVHVQDSYHYKGEAIDVSGRPDRMAKYARKVAQMYGIR